jgi:hypothetical protein
MAAFYFDLALNVKVIPEVPVPEISVPEISVPER